MSGKVISRRWMTSFVVTPEAAKCLPPHILREYIDGNIARSVRQAQDYPKRVPGRYKSVYRRGRYLSHSQATTRRDGISAAIYDNIAYYSNFFVLYAHHRRGWLDPRRSGRRGKRWVW